MGVRTLGVEEEFLLVDPVSARPLAVAQQALKARQTQGAASDPEVDSELFRQMVETATPPCLTADEIGRHLVSARASAAKSAEAAGAALVASGAPVLADRDPAVTPDARYRRILDEFGLLARGSIACAMHVHVDVSAERDAGTETALLDRVGPWLPVLLALSANSPYWYGQDSGYASWRAQVWTRWPSHGTGERFGSRAVYESTTRRMTEWGAALDDAMVYFDARLSARYPTLEIRVADVCTDLDDAVLVAALARGLVETSARGAPVHPEWRSDLLLAASWRASRYGVSGRLVDPRTMELDGARAVVQGAIDHAAEALEEAGDLDLVRELAEQVFSRGNGAVRQRRARERTGELEGVELDLRQRTEDSWADPGRWS